MPRRASQVSRQMFEWVRRRRLICWSLPILCGLVNAVAAPGPEPLSPVASWSFEDSEPAVARDDITGRADAVTGFQKRVPGARGSALRLDGYTTLLSRPAAEAPKISNDLTIECWIALEAYPWGRCALVAQTEESEPAIAATSGMVDLTPENAPRLDDPRAGYVLGLDSDGHPTLGIRLNGEWVACRSTLPIPLMRWAHVAATYQSSSGILALYVNGEHAASATGSGTLAIAATADLVIGRNAIARPVDHAIRLGPPALYGLDGCLDEVRIFARALSAPEIKQSCGSASPPADAGLRAPRLPDISSTATRFGAYTTRLKFVETWDEPRREGPDSDVVVLFRGPAWKYVFWRGTNYVPHWINEHGIWYNNEFNETWGGGALGCAEPMSDKQNRFSRVSIIENTAARVVVHWRYALVDSRYVGAYADRVNGWSDWSDEYHVIYPDGIGVRKICLWSSRPAAPHEFQESIVLVPAGSRPDELLSTEAVTLANMAGETVSYSWATRVPAPLDRPHNANIQVINVRSGAKPFLIVSDEAFELDGVHHERPLFRSMDVEIDRNRSLFPWWNHWPVAQIPSDGRWATHADRIGHSSLTTGLEWKDWQRTANSRTRIMLHGLTDLAAKDLAVVARSWLRPPPLEVRGGGVAAKGYDESERAYLLERNSGATGEVVSLRVAASPERPLYHPALIVEGWGSQPARLRVDGRDLLEGVEVSTGIRHTLDRDDLIVWMNLAAERPVEISLSGSPRSPGSR